MKNKNACKGLFILLTCALLHVQLKATHGYFRNGYGTKANGMGGVATAFPQDSIVAATNPAGMIWVGNRVDVGFGLFSPIRQYRMTGNPNFGTVGLRSKSNSNVFLLPHAGINYLLNDCHAFGFTLYANGGMNTNYSCNNGIFGNRRVLGINYMQLIAAPTYSWKFLDMQSLGVSILGAISPFKSKGLESFANPTFSIAPCNVTDLGHCVVPGIGARVGWLGKFSDHIALGAAYATKVYVKKMELYKGLIAEEGKLDIPANMSAGITFENICGWTIAFDFVFIWYEKVPAIGNSIRNFAPLPLNFFNPQINRKLGEGKCAPGFGWRNTPVYRLGFAYEGFKKVIVRAGYSYVRQPIRPDQIDFNIIAPAVVKSHLTFGGTYNVDDNVAVDFAGLYVFKNSVCGASNFGLGTVTLEMYQFAFEMNLGMKF